MMRLCIRKLSLLSRHVTLLFSSAFFISFLCPMVESNATILKVKCIIVLDKGSMKLPRQGTSSESYYKACSRHTCFNKRLLLPPFLENGPGLSVYQ